MKISNKTNTSAANIESAKSAKQSVDGARDKKSVGSSALGESSKVDLSERAQSIKRAKELATPDNSVDEAKVARLQKMIDEGKYNIDASAIADKMVDEHLLMPS